MNYRRFQCVVCDHIYDEQSGDPDSGIAPGTRWEDLPIDWSCSDCGAQKVDFEELIAV